MQRTMEPEVLECCCVTLEVGKSHDLNDLAETLTAAGYTRCDQVEGPGQFALRGGILDVFSPGMDRPCGRSSSGTRWTPWGCSTRTASGARRT